MCNVSHAGGWLKESARDLIAFGSIPFLILTVIRVSFLPSYYPAQISAGAIAFFLLKALFGAELHAGIGLILFFFVSLYYKSRLFAAFAGFIYLGMVCSLLYLGRERREVGKGILFGIFSAAAAYWAVRRIFP